MAGRHYSKKGYADKTDVENFLLIEISSAFDSQIEDWIATAEKTIDNYLGYTTSSGILAEEISEELTECFVDSDLNLKVFPRKSPIISVSDITLKKGTSTLTLTLTDNDGNEKFLIPEPKKFITYPEYEFTYTGSSIITSLAQLRGTEVYASTTYIAGFEEVPPPIRLATVNFVADSVMRQQNKEGLEYIQQGSISKRWAGRDRSGRSDFIRDAYEYLMPYRLTKNWLV